MQVVFDNCDRCDKVKSGFSFLGKPDGAGERPEWIVCPSCIHELLFFEMDIQEQQEKR